MIRIADKAACCGCTACANVCAHGAITMKPDAMGFLYPVVDADKCIDCGLCDKVCSFNPHYNKSDNLPLPDVYAVRHKDMGEVMSSRSGAVFIAISDWVLEQGGVVYGAGYTEHFRVVHKRAVTREERDEFKGSKYVQSDLGTIFKQVKDDLKSGKTVLFSGTPCQIAGLKSFIGKKLYPNLYLVDIVCHGVPSPYIWRDYLAYVEKKTGSIAVSVNFRDKESFGWHDHKESFTFQDKKICRSTYTILFNKHIMFRPSCGVCHYTNFQRPGDLTIGDFWNLEKYNPSFNADDKGVSLLLVNTAKGQSLFNAIEKKVNHIQSDCKQCLQPNLQHPSVLSPLSASFENEYSKYGFIYVAKKYADIGFKYRMRVFLSRVKHYVIRNLNSF